MHLLILSVLSLGCLAIVAAFPWAARRGKLHVPGYVGIAVLAFTASIFCGFASGYRSFSGTPVGVALSLLCFWLAAATVGSILALCFYRQAEV
jgi:hypothetical protein